MPEHPGGTARRDVVTVVCLAAALRVAWVLAAHRYPGGLSDPLLYWRFALDIAHGKGYVSFYGKPTAYYPPGYPYFLGALQWICDGIGLGNHLPIVAGLVQAAIGSGAAGATVLSGRTLGARVAGGRHARQVGLAAGVVLAVWPNLVLYSSAFLSETLFVGAFAIFIAAVLRMRREDGSFATAWAVAAAVSLGIATLVRPQVLAVLVGLAVAWLLGRRGWRVIATDLGVLIVGVAVLLTPWVIRNEVVMHAFIALSDNSGDNLCVGFHPGATGHFEVPPYCNTGEFYTDGPAAELRRDAATRHLAETWATHHVSALPALSVRKLWYTYDTDTDGIRGVESYEAHGFLPSSVRTALHWLCDVAYVVIMAGALVGAVWLLTRRRGGGARHDGTVSAVLLMTLCSGAIPVAFFGDARFKVPTTPLFAILAGVAVAVIADRLASSDGDPDVQPEPVPRTIATS